MLAACQLGSDLPKVVLEINTSSSVVSQGHPRSLVAVRQEGFLAYGIWPGKRRLLSALVPVLHMQCSTADASESSFKGL